MEFSDAVSVGSLAVAAFALWYARRADRRSDEANRRDAARFEREAEDARLRSRASFHAEGKAPDAIGDRFIVSIKIYNRGSATGFGLRVWLVTDEGRVASEVADVKPTALPPSPSPVGVDVIGDGEIPYKLSLRGSWTDDYGEHEDEEIGPWEHKPDYHQ